jgi:hypothetical protein
MRQLIMTTFLSLSLFTTGCSKLFSEVTGKVDGNSLAEGTAFWGGPYVIITDADLECSDFSWVQDRYDDEDETLATDESFKALQFTYSSSEVKDGPVSIAVRDSGAVGWFLSTNKGETEVWQATTGTIDITLDKKERAEGTFEVGFGDSGSLEGTFLIENCVNLTPRP